MVHLPWNAMGITMGLNIKNDETCRLAGETQPAGPHHEGVLLYPVVDEPFAVDVRLEGFRIQARGIDLGQPWKQIHEDMLEVIA